MKKALSLALALIMCLGLAVPAFAAGETTVKNEAGVEYTVSKPVLDSTTCSFYAENGQYFTALVYVLPEGTVITPKLIDAIPDDVGQAILGEQGTDFRLYYELFDWSGQGGPGIEEEGFTLKRENPEIPYYEDYSNDDGVFLIESRLWYMQEEGSTPNTPGGAGGNGGSVSSYKRFFIGFQIGEEASTEPVIPVEPVVKTAEPTNDKLYVDGELAVPTAYKIGGSNYFKIRDMAALLNGTDAQFSVGYDDATQTVTLITGEGYEKRASDLAGVPAGTKEAISSNNAIYINGEKAELTVYKIGGSNYFKLRDLGKALGFYVGYTEGYGAFIETDKPYA